MITCFLKYQIDPYQLDQFEQYGKHWIDLVNRMGGDHHGYLLPFEGPNHIAYASFSFPSLADYEHYRKEIDSCPTCQEVLLEAKENRYIISYERSFMKPIFKGHQDQARMSPA